MVVGAWLFLAIVAGLLAQVLILLYGLAANRIRGNPGRQRRTSLQLSIAVTGVLLLLVLIWALIVLPELENAT